MAAIGQAQANAELVKDFFERSASAPGYRVLFAGAGTGQWLEFTPPDFLYGLSVTFADINVAYLNLLSSRLSKFPKLAAEFRVDDIEASSLPAGFGVAIAVLVLEHVDWKKAVRTLCRLCSGTILAIIQENPPALSSAMTPSRPVAGSMSVFQEVHPTLLSKSELTAEFAAHGFFQKAQTERTVLDDKRMVALEFSRGD